MDRRLLVTALACWPAGRLLAQADPPVPRFKLSAAKLHEALTARFPRRFGPPGLFEVELNAPRLLLLPGRQKLGATLRAELSRHGRTRGESGELDVVFSLRWEPSDRTLRAHELEVLDLRWPGLPSRTRETIQAVLPALARESVGEFVLHRFTPKDLGLADTMGFQPERFTVVDDGVVVVLGPK